MLRMIYQPSQYSDYGWASGYSQAVLTASGAATANNVRNDPATGTIYANLSKLSDFLGKLNKYLPGLSVNSGYRNPTVNALVGGADKSAHMSGLAADIVVPGWSNKAVATWLFYNQAKFPEMASVIWYTDTGHTHVQIGGGPSKFLKGSKSSGSYSDWSPYKDYLRNAGVLALALVGGLWVKKRFFK